MVLMSLVSHPNLGRRRDTSPSPEAPPPSGRRVFVPSPEELRRLIPVQPRAARPRPAPVPQPTPPPAEKLKDRISIGPPSEERSKKPLLLRKEDDLTKVPKGTPNATPATPAPPMPSLPPPVATAKAGDTTETPRSPGLKMPPGLGDMLRGEEGSRKGAQGPPQPSIASAAKDYVDRQLRESGARGVPTGTGQQMGPLFFDPEGADFTLWI